MVRKLGVASKFLEYSLNAPDLSILVVEGAAKVRLKSQGCRQAKKFALKVQLIRNPLITSHGMMDEKYLK